MLTRLVLTLAVAAAAGPAAPADDPKPPEPAPAKPANPLEEAKKQFEREANALRTKLRRAKTAEDEKKVKDEFEALKTRFLAKLVGLAEKRPDTEETFGLLVELSEVGGETGKRARELIAAHHAAKPWVRAALPALARGDDPAGPEALAAIAKANPDRTTRGLAYLFLGIAEKRLAAAAPADRQPAHVAAAEKALATARDEYADVAYGRDEKVGKAAAAALAGVKNLPHLVVGKTAPDLAGEDLDGKPMKLGDYRGKVVLLDFWATWCGPCMRLVPHNRRLIETYKDRPFALLGVNADEDSTALEAGIKRHRVNWRSFKNAAGDGPAVTDQWNVEGFPTLYLMDHNGVIRKTWVGVPEEEELDREVADLVAAAEKDKK